MKSLILARRELASYFATPLAYVFLIIFVVMAGIFTFYVGDFFKRGQADLEPFFLFHPWLYMLLIPAVTMRLWAEERKSGTIELLMTLPMTSFAAVLGKYLAALLFCLLALILTFPVWLTVNILGNPDNMVILAGYFGSFLMAASMLAVGACLSALTKNQVVAFVMTMVAGFLMVFGGTDMVASFARESLSPQVAGMVTYIGFWSHFSPMVQGIVDLRDVLFFISFIAFWLFANVIVVEVKKAE